MTVCLQTANADSDDIKLIPDAIRQRECVLTAEDYCDLEVLLNTITTYTTYEPWGDPRKRACTQYEFKLEIEKIWSKLSPGLKDTLLEKKA